MAPQAIVFVIASAGVTGLTAGGALTLTGSLLAGAIGIGLQLGIGELFGPKQPKPEGVKGVFRQSTPIRTKHRGTCRVGGKLLYIGVKGGGLLQVVYLGQGPTTGFLEHLLDDRAFTVNPTTGVAINDEFENRLAAWFREGADDQSAFEKLIEFDPARWTVDHRAKGCILALIRTARGSTKTFNKRFPNRISQYNAVLKGVPDFDPRTGATAYTANLAIHTRGYLTDPDGAQIDPAYIDDATFITAADRADDLLPTKGGGTVRRFHGSFSYDFDMEPGQNVARLVQATCGRLYLTQAGKIGFKVGVWEEPTVSIPAEHIIDFDLTDRSGPLKDTNEVVVRYTNPLARYSEAACEAWRDETDISQSGIVKNTTLTAIEINNHYHARFVAKNKAAKLGARWQGKVRTTLYGMKAWDQRFIRLTIPELEIFDESFEVDAIETVDSDMTVLINVISMSAADFAPLTDDEQGTPPVNPDDIEPDAVEIPQNVTVVVTQRVISSGQSIPVITLSWDEPDDDSLIPDVSISPADAEDWKSLYLDDDDRKVEATDLVGDALYDLRVRFREPSGELGTYVLKENVRAVADAVAPGTPEIPQISVSGTTVTVSQRGKKNDGHTKFLRWRAGSPAVAVSDLPEVDRQQGFAGDVRIFSETRGPGVWHYYGDALNGSEIPSVTPNGPLVATISGQTLNEPFSYADGALDVVGAANWTQMVGASGAASVVGGKLRATGTSSFYVAKDTFSQRAYVQSDILFTAASANCFLALFIDQQNYVAVRYLSGQIQLVQRLANVTSTVATATVAIPAPGTTGTMTKDLLAVTVTVGATTINYTLPSGLLAASKPGLAIAANTGADFIDNFKAGIP